MGLSVEGVEDVFVLVLYAEGRGAEVHFEGQQSLIERSVVCRTIELIQSILVEMGKPKLVDGSLKSVCKGRSWIDPPRSKSTRSR